MRDDAIGLFWEDLPAAKGDRTVAQRPMPDIPETGWRAPTSFPNLSTARVLSVDTETYDPHLLDRGPGWARGDGHIVGVSVGADSDGKWYFPLRHETEPEHNMDPGPVIAWLRDTLSNPSQPKVGANLLYDLGWLRTEGVEVAGELVDVQLAEALLQERGSVDLDYLGSKYCDLGKDTSQLYRWLADWYGGNPDGKQRRWIYKAPPRLVGPYAEMDALLPMQIAKKQYPLLLEQGLLPVLEMENGLIRLMMEMRYAGVRVDVPKAEKLRDRFLAMQQEAQTALDKLAGETINVNSSASIAVAFDALGLDYPRTAQGNPSFTRSWLEHHAHPIAEHIREVRRVEKLRSTFVESYILDSHVDSMVYGQFHLLRSDSGGTRSGRFSSSTPNLQNIPARDEELAPLVRGLFIPDEGHKQWRRYDASQIEYRGLVHFAQGPGADEARQRYINDPKTDYHQFAIDMIYEITKYRLSRKPAKNINFGFIYGMGMEKLRQTLGLSRDAAKELFEAYHKALPYVKATMDATMEEAQQTGVITTVLGRRSRFELFEPRGFDPDAVALPIQQAIRHYGVVQRAHTHKALNRRLQGSAADVMKYGMWRCWEDGIFQETGVPRLTVHDELDFSDPGGRDEAFQAMQHTLETALPLRVPVRYDHEIGPNWGELGG